MSTPLEIEEARTQLEMAGVFYHTRKDLAEARAGEWGEWVTEDYLKEMENELQELNMNDVWGWALAYGVKVADEDLPELARLYHAYGYCGVLYWVAEKDGWERSEFNDITRYVEFVRNEEAIKKELPGSNARAYAKRGYVLGGWWQAIKGLFT
jgi:hypothetical protein